MAARKWSGPNRITPFMNLQISRTSQPLEGEIAEAAHHTCFMTSLWALGLSEGDQGGSPACDPAFLLWPHTLLTTPSHVRGDLGVVSQ